MLPAVHSMMKKHLLSKLIQLNKHITGFGCGTSGDVIEYLDKKHGFTFMDAVRHLADRANIEIPTTEWEESTKPLYAALAKAADIFQENFHGSPAEAYMIERGFEHDMLEVHQAGYAVDSWSYLFERLLNDFDYPTLSKAGLIRTPDETRNPYDFFRDRLVFPIHNESGRVVGFSARKLDYGNTDSKDKSEGKYINTPETPLFKRKNFFTIYILQKGMQDFLMKLIL